MNWSNFLGRVYNRFRFHTDNYEPKFIVLTSNELNYNTQPILEGFKTIEEAEKSIASAYRKEDGQYLIYELKDVLDVKYSMLVTSKKDNVAAS